MPWHVATLIKEWAQYIVPLHFYILLHGLDLSYPCIFRIDPHVALAAPHKDENPIPYTLS